MATRGVICAENLIRPIRSSRGGLAEEALQALTGLLELVLLAHRAGVVEHHHHVRRLAVGAPRLLDLDQHLRLGQAQDALRLAGIDAVGRGDEAGRGGTGVGGAEAVAAGHLGRDLRGQVGAEDLGGALLLGGHPVALQRHQRVVGEERALLRVDRDEPLAVARAPVEVDHRDLLHRHRRRVAEATAAHLVGDEQRRVAVVDDRALQPAHLRAAARDVGLGQALLLADRRVVGGGDRGQAGGGEVRVGVHVLERPELRLADRGPAAGGKLLELLVAELALGVAVRVGQPLPHRDHERCAHDRRVLVGDEAAVGLVVEQPAPERGRRRPQGRAQAALGDLRLRLTGGHDLGVHVDGAGAAGVPLRVEALDQRREHRLLLRRVGERHVKRVGRRLRLVARARARRRAPP